MPSVQANAVKHFEVEYYPTDDIDGEMITRRFTSDVSNVEEFAQKFFTKMGKIDAGSHYSDDERFDTREEKYSDGALWIDMDNGKDWVLSYIFREVQPHEPPTQI